MPRKGKKPLKARILYAMAFCCLILLGCIFLLTTLIRPFWAVFIFLLILIPAVRGYNFFEGLGDKALEAAGFGIKSLERLGAEIKEKNEWGLSAMLKWRDRYVYVDTIKREEIDPQIPSLNISKYTRILIKYTDKIPYIIQMQRKNKKLPKFYDICSYNEWIVKKKENILSSPPRRIKIKLEDLPPTIIDKAKRIFYNPNLALLEGTLRIEEEQIFFLDGHMLVAEYLEMVINTLIDLAEEIEKEFRAS